MNHMLTDDMELEQAAATPFPNHKREKSVVPLAQRASGNFPSFYTNNVLDLLLYKIKIKHTVL
ncbi:hypothetical protein HanLR1_Chr02g0068371 [Helianthus annuus]|nr:hypothetical protein HanLR1_Chr02g0068371 [Helianthus annuus]